MHYQLVDQRGLNTLCIDARTQGINCWDKDVSRLLYSQKIADFHPFQNYVATLPQWDGINLDGVEKVRNKYGCQYRVVSMV